MRRLSVPVSRDVPAVLVVPRERRVKAHVHLPPTHPPRGGLPACVRASRSVWPYADGLAVLQATRFDRPARRGRREWCMGQREMGYRDDVAAVLALEHDIVAHELDQLLVHRRERLGAPRTVRRPHLPPARAHRVGSERTTRRDCQYSCACVRACVRMRVCARARACARACAPSWRSVAAAYLGLLPVLPTSDKAARVRYTAAVRAKA